jgi:hypothetical protein
VPESGKIRNDLEGGRQITGKARGLDCLAGILLLIWGVKQKTKRVRIDIVPVADIIRRLPMN